MDKNVFICHSSNDHDFVIQLAEKLKKDSIEVWIDDWEIDVGDSITQKVSEGLHKAGFFLIILSENSINSDWVARELNSTLMRQINKKNVKILPVLLDADFSEIPPLIADINAVRFNHKKIDEIEYRKLIKPIINNLEQEIFKNYQDEFLYNVEHIDIIIKKDKPTKSEITFIQSIIKEDVYLNYFLRNITSLFWFSILKNNGYFSPDKAPGPKLIDNNNYYIPNWNVLSYLEKASKQLGVPQGESYVEEFLVIIKNVTNYVAKNNQEKDNFYTWWSFVKILLDIPNNRIPLEIIELIPIWLQSRFGTRLQGVDIATKLLPKFMQGIPSTEDIEKATNIIDYITDIRLVPTNEKRTRSYKRADEYELVIDDFWLRKASENNADIIGKICSRNVVDILSTKIKKLLNKEAGRAVLENGDGTTYHMILSEDNNNHILKVTRTEGETNNYFYEKEQEGMIIDIKSFPKSKSNTFIEKAFTEFKGIEPFKEINDGQIKQRLKYAFQNLYDEGTYTSLYSKKYYSSSKPLEVLTDFLKRILVSKAKYNVQETAETLSSFFDEDYLYFPKMALFIIAENVDIYGQIFWNQLARKNYTIIRDDLYFGDELKHLLNNIKQYSAEQKAILNKIIELGPIYYVTEEVDDEKKYSARWKQKRYEALTHVPEFKDLYESYKATSGVDVQLRPAVGEVETRWGHGKSDLTKEQILTMSNKELSIFLLQAKNEGSWEGSKVNALADMLKEAVKSKPEKFSADISPFLKNGYLWIYDILWGFRDAWKDKQSIDWKEIINFIKQYIFQDDFWEDKYMVVNDDHYTANHNWVVGEIAELIEDGTRKDTWAFDESLLADAEVITLKILDNLKVERKEEQDEEDQDRDPITYTLNSTFGKTLNAFLNLALRKARMEKKTGDNLEIRWSQTFKDKYEKALRDKIPEAYTLLGQYMPNFLFLDKAWVEKKIVDFERLENHKLWASFMYGYLYIHNFYDELYLLMGNHYRRALKSTMKADRAQERLIEHISIAYLRGLEDFSEHGSFGILIKNWDTSQIKDVINLFWTMRGPLDKTAAAVQIKERQRIKDFWKLVYDKYKDLNELNEEDKIVLSDISKLIVFLEDINHDNLNWLMLSAKYVNIDFNSPFFVEDLDRLKDKGESARYIGKIYLAMLDNFTPDYDQKHIVSTIDYLYSQGHDQIQDANKICNIYTSKGIDFLRATFNKYK